MATLRWNSAIIGACREHWKDVVERIGEEASGARHTSGRARARRFGALCAAARAEPRRALRAGAHAPFPDGETLVRVTHRAGAEAILVQSFNDPDRKLMPALLAADALRRAGARRVTLVAPYLAYMRQDRIFHPGEPISQRVFGQCLGRAFDRVLTVEAHLHRIHRLSDVMAGPRSVAQRGAGDRAMAGTARHAARSRSVPTRSRSHG